MTDIHIPGTPAYGTAVLQQSGHLPKSYYRTDGVTLSKSGAETCVGCIKSFGKGLVSYIIEAHAGRAWIALKYKDWDDLCLAEFGQKVRVPKDERLEMVLTMRAAEMSTRAIGAAVGVNEKTVRNDLAGAEYSAPAEIRGNDGKTYQAIMCSEEQRLQNLANREVAHFHMLLRRAWEELHSLVCLELPDDIEELQELLSLALEVEQLATNLSERLSTKLDHPQEDDLDTIRARARTQAAKP